MQQRNQIVLVSLTIILILSVVTDLLSQNSLDQFYFVQDDKGHQIGEVKGIIADKNGLIWLATESGLHTYNGYSFQNIHLYADSLQISEPSLNTISYDSSRHLLFTAGDENIYSYDIKNKRAAEFSILSNHHSSSPQYFKQFYHETNQTFYIPSYNGLIKCHTDSLTCHQFQLKTDRSEILEQPYLNRFTSIIPHVHPDSLWIGSLLGIFSYHKKTKHFNLFWSSFDDVDAPIIVTSLIRKGNELFIGTYNYGVGVIDLSNRQSKLITNFNALSVPSEPIVNRIIRGQNDLLWVCTEIGLFDLNIQDYEMRYFKNTAPPIFGENNTACNFIYLDKLDHLWVGMENGLSQWDPSRYLIKTYSNQNIFGTEEIDPVIDIYKTNGNEFLVGLYNQGFYSMLPKTNQFHPKYFNKINQKVNSLKYFFPVKNNFWVVGDREGFWKYYPDSETIEPLLNKKQLVEGDLKMFLSSHYFNKRNELWYGLQWGRGVGRINLQTGDLKLYPQSTFVPDSLIRPGGLETIRSDHDGQLWISTASGIAKFDPETETAVHYTIENLGGSLSPKSIGIAIDNENNCWATFANKGLYFHDKNQDKFVKASFSLTPEMEALGKIAFQENGILWGVSNAGLISIDLQSEKVISYTSENGLPVNRIQFSNIKLIDNNYIFITSQNWFGFLDLTQLDQSEKYALTPSIESILVDGEPRNISEKINLSYKENNLTISFPVLNYKSKTSNNYSYKLSGINNSWVSNGSSKEVQFNHLSPGNYVFEVKSGYEGSQWSQPVSIPIKVKGPWWKSWWYYAFSLILIGLSVLLFNRYRIKQIRHEESIKSDYEKKLLQLEMEALRSQMNPHFIFNALNSIKHFILANDKFLAAEYLSNFSRLVRKILNNSKSSTISLADELETLQLYLEMEQLRFNDQFDYTLEVDPLINLEEISIPPLILQPFVENSIWHGLMHKEEKGLLKIIVRLGESSVICIIEDDGIGRKKAKEINTKSALKKKSFGMQITNSRITMSSVKATSKIIDLVDPEGNVSGTRVEINIPILHPTNL